MVMKQLFYSPIPLCLAFEPINLCNAKCFCCPYTEFSEDKTFITQKMSKEQITQLIENWAQLLKKHKIKPWSVALLPWRYSDPLVNPHLGLVLELADKHQLNVSLTTNAVSFGKRQCDLLQKYVHTLTKIFVSVIGFTEEEVWREVDRALEENKDNQFTDGQVLFFNMVFCANPQYFFDPYLEFIFKEYAFSKEFDVPIANNIDEVPYEKMVIFSAISEEINACQKHKMETSKNG